MHPQTVIALTKQFSERAGYQVVKSYDWTNVGRAVAMIVKQHGFAKNDELSEVEFILGSGYSTHTYMNDDAAIVYNTNGSVMSVSVFSNNTSALKLIVKELRAILKENNITLRKNY